MAARKKTLGSLLLRSLAKKRPANRKRQGARKKSAPVRLFQATRSRVRPKRSSKPRAPTPIQTPPIPVLPADVPAVLGGISSGAGAALSTQDLIRPGEELKSTIEAFLLDQRSPHTQRAYGKDLKRFVQFLLQRKFERGIEKLDRAVLIAYKDSLLSEGLEHTTVDRHLATLRSFFRWLVDEGKIVRSPAEGVRFLKPRKLSTTRGFSDEEVRRVLALPNAHTRTGAMHLAVLTVLFYCGLRRSELCALKTTNLGVERGQPVIKLRGKGNSERLIVLMPRVWQALNHYFKITGKNPAREQHLFTPIRNNRTGVNEKALDPSMVFYIVKRYAQLAGVQGRVSPHSCRATAISNARDHQVSDRAIQEFAGWATPDMITRYDKRKTSIEQSAARAIAYGDENSSAISIEPRQPEDLETERAEGHPAAPPAPSESAQTTP